MRGLRSWTIRLAGCTALALIQACAQPESPAMPAEPAIQRDSPSACDTSAARFALGKEPLPALVETARRQAGAARVRVIRHDEMITKEYLPTRLNLQLDVKGLVVRAYCG